MELFRRPHSERFSKEDLRRIRTAHGHQLLGALRPDAAVAELVAFHRQNIDGRSQVRFEKFFSCDLILKVLGCRIVAVASSVHKKPMVGRFPLEDIHRRNSSGGGITAYGYSKVNFNNSDFKLTKRFDSLKSCFSSTGNL